MATGEIRSTKTERTAFHRAFQTWAITLRLSRVYSGVALYFLPYPSHEFSASACRARSCRLTWHPRKVMQHGMPRTRTPKPTIAVRGIALSDEEVNILRRLSQDASAVVGRRVSSSAVLRAAVRWLGAQGTRVSRDHLIPLIEAEMGLLHWGRKK